MRITYAAASAAGLHGCVLTRIKVVDCSFDHMSQLSRFQRAAPILPFIQEISRLLALMSDINEFPKSITLFINSMQKSCLLVTKLGACVALGHHLHHEQ